MTGHFSVCAAMFTNVVWEHIYTSNNKYGHFHVLLLSKGAKCALFVQYTAELDAPPWQRQYLFTDGFTQKGGMRHKSRCFGLLTRRTAGSYYPTFRN